MEFAGGPELVSELERNMRLDERVLKFITVKLDDRFDPEKEESLKASAASTSDEAEAGPVAASMDAEDWPEEVSEGKPEDDASQAEENRSILARHDRNPIIRHFQKGKESWPSGINDAHSIVARFAVSVSTLNSR